VAVGAGRAGNWAGTAVLCRFRATWCPGGPVRGRGRRGGLEAARGRCGRGGCWCRRTAAAGRGMSQPVQRSHCGNTRAGYARIVAPSLENAVPLGLPGKRPERGRRGSAGAGGPRRSRPRRVDLLRAVPRGGSRSGSQSSSPVGHDREPGQVHDGPLGRRCRATWTGRARTDLGTVVLGRLSRFPSASPSGSTASPGVVQQICASGTGLGHDGSSAATGRIPSRGVPGLRDVDQPLSGSGADQEVDCLAGPRAWSWRPRTARRPESAGPPRGRSPGSSSARRIRVSSVTGALVDQRLAQVGERACGTVDPPVEPVDEQIAAGPGRRSLRPTLRGGPP
jgi:hypothetical protein